MSVTSAAARVIPNGFKIIDPHLHFWCPSKFKWLQNIPKEYNWLKPAAKTHAPADYLRNTRSLDIEKTIHIQAKWELSGPPVGESEYMRELASAAESRGHPHGFATWAPLNKPAEAEPILAAHREVKGFKGIRFMLDYDPERLHVKQTDKDYIDDPEFRAGLRLLEEAGLHFELQLTQCQLARAAELASNYPKLTFILNHCGFPSTGLEAQWREGLALLAQNDNVVTKISALGMWEGGWNIDQSTPIVEACVDAFGVRRCMFASNQPVDGANGKNTVGTFEDFYSIANSRMQLRDDELRAMFYDNANAAYRL